MIREPAAKEASGADSIWSNRPFMLLWSAQAVSQTAQNAIWFALMVLIEETTQSTAQVGIAIVTFILPSVVFTVPAGVLVDRIDKRLVLVATNWLRAVVVLGYIFFHDSLATVYAVTFVFAVISQFFLPAEAAMIPALVGRRRLITANSLFNLTFTMSQLVGIVFLAPIAIKLFGVNSLFIVIAVLFAVCGFLVLPLPGRVQSHTRSKEITERPGGLGKFMDDLRELWSFITSDRKATMAMLSLTSGATLSLVMAMLAPRFMVSVVGIRADDTVFVLAPAGFGMALGALAIGRLTRWVPKELLVVVGMLGLASGLALLAVVTPFWGFVHGWVLPLLVNPGMLPPVVSLISVVMLVAGIMGLGLSLVIISSQTILQERAPVGSRGRIFAAQIMLGNLASILPLVLLGWLADVFGVSQVMLLLAAAAFVLCYGASRTYGRVIWGDQWGRAAPRS